jgi:hypothetical protein
MSNIKETVLTGNHNVLQSFCRVGFDSLFSLNKLIRVLDGCHNLNPNIIPITLACVIILVLLTYLNTNTFMNLILLTEYFLLSYTYSVFIFKKLLFL